MPFLYSAKGLNVRPLARVFKALGDETRLRILALLGNHDLCVSHIADAIGLSQPAASRHLSVLRGAGLVDTRRRGRWIWYTVTQPTDMTAQKVITDVVERFSDHELKRDLIKMAKANGPALP